MSRIKICSFFVGFIAIPHVAAPQDFRAEVRKASGELRSIFDDVESLATEGRLDEGNEKLLKVFPERRTAAQSFTLGNVLFKTSPKLSYALHKAAAREMPDEPLVQMEWGMQQHRAGEYAGAAKSYAVLLTANPNLAPFWGLQAECLLRTGRIKEATEAWKKSERAKTGTLIQFERYVCEINSHLHPVRDRADLRRKAAKADLAAARRLVALDCRFEMDWWNRGTNPDYLEVDLKLLRKIEWQDQAKEVICAAEAALEGQQPEGNVGDVLRKHGYLLDDNRTLPSSGLMLSCMLAATESSGTVSLEKAREMWGDAVLKRAQQTKDAEYYNVAAHLHLRTAKIAEIQSAGWKVTRDERFAVGVITNLVVKGTLKLDHPDLLTAMKRFPQNSELMRYVVQLNAKAGRPMKPVLIRAIKAEYSKFSLKSPLTPRPGATALRRYFLALAEELKNEGDAGDE